jgi:ribosomal protein S18 acetylase RimI-like enzyme
MSIVKFIPKSVRNQNIELVQKIADAIFGTPESAEFAERFVPAGGKVPYPKERYFSDFLLNYPKCLWAVFDSEKQENVVGFILISDRPHDNSMGVGINPAYNRRGLMTKACNEIISGNNQCIIFPLNAYTSENNKAAIGLLEKTGFTLAGKISFAGEPSLRYTIKA